ncbi:MAG: hypothetical protein PHN69_02575 [Candidatus Pacebacteria bacterium]|nr:hypothetical protein [Candidatus Paceibacterota bacterium]
MKIVLDKTKIVWYNIVYKIKTGDKMINFFKLFSKKEKIEEISTSYKNFIIKNKFINHEVIKKNILWVFKNKSKDKK